MPEIILNLYFFYEAEKSCNFFINVEMIWYCCSISRIEKNLWSNNSSHIEIDNPRGESILLKIKEHERLMKENILELEKKIKEFNDKNYLK